MQGIATTALFLPASSKNLHTCVLRVFIAMIIPQYFHLSAIMPVAGIVHKDLHEYIRNDIEVSASW